MSNSGHHFIINTHKEHSCKVCKFIYIKILLFMIHTIKCAIKKQIMELKSYQRSYTDNYFRGHTEHCLNVANFKKQGILPNKCILLHSIIENTDTY